MGVSAFRTVWMLLAFMVKLTSCLHLEIAYGNFEELTCYTCSKMSDNTECNDWAPNIPCQLRHTVCKSVHRINGMTGESVQVDKMCSLPDHCTSDHVGCSASNRETEIECVSCCTESFCNIAVPYNISTPRTHPAFLIGSASSHVTNLNGVLFISLTGLLRI